MTTHATEPKLIIVRGARTHNLVDVDLELPRNRLIVITGPSGSGKSSLAFDTIYAEGQRRYVESLSVSARQFLAQLPKPDVELVDGLSPTLALEQISRARSPRATVGTVTEVYDYLRLLFARVGVPHSHVSGAAMVSHSVDDVVAQAMQWPEKTRFSVLAPLRTVAGEDPRPLLADLRRDAFVRVAIDDEVVDLGEGDPEGLDPTLGHEFEVYVDRLVIKAGIESRLADSVESAMALAGGRVDLLPLTGERRQFSRKPRDFEHDVEYPELTPGRFSFNSPDGACSECDGLGVRTQLAIDGLVPYPNRSLEAGAIRSPGKTAKTLARELAVVCAHHDIPMDIRWQELSGSQQSIILDGSGDEGLSWPGPRGKVKAGPWIGLRAQLAAKLAELERAAAEEGDSEPAALADLRELMIEVQCPNCEGERLRVESRMVRVGGENLPAYVRRPLDHLRSALAKLQFDAERAEIASGIIERCLQRIDCLIELGLSYLTLDRQMASLSGGESQRTRLATQVGTSLVGVTYVLDEPSIGLHQRDNARLIAMLERLRDHGNTVIVVEHDEDMIRAADHVVDMGPGAGRRGGRVVASGALEDIMGHRLSLTAAYLNGSMRVQRTRAALPPTRASITIRGARGHNLKSLTARIPLGALTCVSGVSGSGKSSLIMDTLLPEARRRVHDARVWGLEHEGIDGLEHITRVISVDQSPIGRSPRSNPATYTGIFAELRSLFAKLSEAKVRGFSSARFSFNVKGGRCEACRGEGVRRVEMHFLPDVWVECRSCKGRRYNRETLAVRYRGKSIADVLECTVAEACEFFAHHPKLIKGLEVLRDVGLGYMTLGQSAQSLSGGEAQRIKLARELARKDAGHALFVLDEPTTGLHAHDVSVLLQVLERLVDEGHSVVVIEHNLDMIAAADHVLDIGPEGGEAGGELVAAGPPSKIAQVATSYTGQWLARFST